MINNVYKYFWEDPAASYYKDGKKYWQSVHGRSYVRYNKAKKEIDNKAIVPMQKIIDYINELLKAIGITQVQFPIMSPSEVNYTSLKEKFDLDDERDIVWIKFTEDGFVGVVATSNDINFNIPPNASVYDNKILKYNGYTKKDELVWKYNSSGILVHKLKKKWNESLVLVFPLKELSENCTYSRHEIEMAIGNYLIEQQVPIIDYYSHYIG